MPHALSLWDLLLMKLGGDSPISATKCLPFHGFSSTFLVMPCCHSEPWHYSGPWVQGLPRSCSTNLCIEVPGAAPNILALRVVSAGESCGVPSCAMSRILAAFLAKVKTQFLGLGARGGWQSGLRSRLLVPPLLFPFGPQCVLGATSSSLCVGGVMALLALTVSRDRKQ